MPRVSIPIKEVERAITRPVAMAVIRELFPRWSMDVDKCRLMMYGSTESIPTTGSTLHKEALPHRLFNDLTVLIEVDENYANYEAPYLPFREKEFPPIYLDPKLRIGVRPVMREVETSISVTINAKSRTHAEQLRRRMHAELRSYASYDSHEVDYHYQIPHEVVIILSKLHELREANYGYGETFKDWFNAHSDNRIVANRNQGEKGHYLALAEKQVSITGHYDFNEDIPKPDPSTAGMQHTVSFTYRYTYMRPEHLLIYYPLAVHNQMIPDLLIDKDHCLTYQDFVGQIAWSMHGLSNLNYFQDKPSLDERVNGLAIPYYDDWHNFIETDSFHWAVKALVGKDEANPHDVINLDTGLVNWNFSDGAIAYMKRRLNKLFIQFDSIIHIALYKWDQMQPPSLLNIDSDLNITLSGEIDPRCNYHLVVSMMTDPFRLSKDGLDDLLLNGGFAGDYLDVLYPGIKGHISPPAMPPTSPLWYLNPDGSLSKEYWDAILKDITGLIKRTKPNRTQIYASIITYKDDNNAVNA